MFTMLHINTQNRLTMNIQIIITFLLITTFYCEAFKVLLAYPLPVKSLNNLGEGHARHLLDAGHEVTFITAFPVKNKIVNNLRQIDVSENLEIMKDDFLNITAVMSGTYLNHGNIQELQELAYTNAVNTFQNKKIRKLLEDKNEKFDVIIADLFETELYSGLAALYDCPFIWSYSMGAHWLVLRLIAEASNPSYTVDYLSANNPPFNFVQRIEELWAQIKWSLIKRFVTAPKEEASYNDVFKPLLTQRGKPLPSYEDVVYNASLIFVNDHYAFGNNPSTPQNLRFVGGQHIHDPILPLPENLQSLMDNSKHGVIYFSMGSTWKSKDIPKSTTQNLLKIFSELKQTVLWKYEIDLPNLPQNVNIIKWAPQQSILAHRNCLFFITHGGLLSSTEAIHFGVPIIGVPILFDQFLNINKAVQHGYGIRTELNFDLHINLKIAIQKMLDDHSYKQRVQELSRIYHDRLVSPGAELVHWVEHVVRTRGAPHLRSPALRVPWYQKMYLDLAALILAISIVLKMFFTRLYALVFAEKKTKINKKKRN